MIRITAANVALRHLRETIYRLAQVPRRTAEIAAPKISDLLREEFREGEDPYGHEWAALRPATLAKGRHPPPLTDKTKLRDGTRVAQARSKGLRLVAGATYGAFHQVGFRVGKRRVPPRRIFPQFGLPRAWSEILRAAARQAGQEAVR